MKTPGAGQLRKRANCSQTPVLHHADPGLYRLESVWAKSIFFREGFDICFPDWSNWRANGDKNLLGIK
jgi:hypothetical protein